MNEWVVVVDDEALCLTNARNILGEEKMRVSCLKSGKDLLRFMEKNTPDLILLDVLMPEMDGFETYRALREFEEKAGMLKTPVIFLTGENDSETEERGLKLGASDFMRKPFNKDILTSRIRNTINNSKTIESLTEEATLDKLTGFLNKSSGTSRVTARIEKGTGALLIMDLDSFKLVNDLYGHDMGDRVLEAFADVVREHLNEQDLASRIGGDEFMAFIDGAGDEQRVAAFTESLNNTLSERAAILMGKDHGIPLGVSVGAVLVPEYGRDYETLFAFADGALYNVKQNGKHGSSVYTHEDKEMVIEGTDLEAEINRITRIIEERNEGQGALLLGKEAFSTVYQFIMRYGRMHGGGAVKALFSLSVEDEAKAPDNLNEVYTQFGLILQKSLRRSDLVMQSKTNHFFVFLPELSHHDLPGLMGRILSNWNETEYSRGIKVEHAVQFVSA